MGMDTWGAGKFGPRNDIAVDNASKRWKLVVPNLVQGQEALFCLRPAVDMYILQGASNVPAVTSSNGTHLVAGMYFPLRVESEQDFYISLIRDSSNGNLEISLISDVQSWSIVSA